MSMDTATDTQAVAAGTAGPAKAPKVTKAGNAVKYPCQLKVNITPEMNQSLARVARQYDAPEGLVGRMALKAFLANQDPLFRQALNSLEANERNQE
jgi:hypothetical protein